MVQDFVHQQYHQFHQQLLNFLLQVIVCASSLQAARWRFVEAWEKLEAKSISTNTIDGRNPDPVDMKNLPVFTGFYTSHMVQEFLPSTVGLISLHTPLKPLFFSPSFFNSTRVFPMIFRSENFGGGTLPSICWFGCFQKKGYPKWMVYSGKPY